jgi:hypothetical protein
MKKISLLLLATCLIFSSFAQVRKTTTYPVRTAKKPGTVAAKKSKSSYNSMFTPAITPVANAQEKNVVYQYVDTTVTNSENQFPSTGFVGIGTKKPQAPIEIKKNAGDTRKKNILLQLTNSWSPNGQNEPSIMFSNGDDDKMNNSYWTVGARVSGDNTINTPQSFKVCYKRAGVDVEQEFFSINSYEGRVKIGNVNDLIDGYKLYVEQGIITEKVKVAVANSEDWYDNVFEPSYKKMELKDIESFVKKYKHLPDIPSTADVLKDGIDLGKMNGLLLKKIEELTLHMIDIKKELDATKKEVQLLKSKKK